MGTTAAQPWRNGYQLETASCQAREHEISILTTVIRKQLLAHIINLKSEKKFCIAQTQ
jgi:hypothetical protein